MYFFELSKQILRDMRRHKVRSILAMFGIIWGTIAVIMLLALGQGFYAQNRANIMSVVSGTLTFSPGTTTMDFQGWPKGLKIHIKAADIMALKKAIPDIRYVSPQMTSSKTLSVGKHQVNAMLIGASPDFAELTKRQAKPGGRFIDPLDISNQRNVIFIGKEVKDKLFPQQSALGKQLLLSSVPFTIIGVLNPISKTQSWYNNTAVIPYTTAIKLWGNIDVNQFLVLPKNSAQTEQLASQVRQYLSQRYHFNPKDKSALNLFNPAQMLEFFTWFFRGIELFLGFCGSLTLAVGAIGVANIMYLIVSERTPEIGLRMALGARTTHILWQILLETGVIVLAGGIIGIILSVLGIGLLNIVQLPSWLGKPHITWAIVFATVFILLLVGGLAGIFPARRAANMEPVDALAAN